MSALNAAEAEKISVLARAKHAGAPEKSIAETPKRAELHARFFILVSFYV